VNAAWVTVRAWTLSLRGVRKWLATARLRWCLACGRVGLWGWRPLTPSMPITWVCADRPGCQQRQAGAEARRQGGGAASGRLPCDSRATRRGSGLAPHPGWGWPRLVRRPRDRRRPAPASPWQQEFEGGSR
jgi:hypothetical protein